MDINVEIAEVKKASDSVFDAAMNAERLGDRLARVSSNIIDRCYQQGDAGRRSYSALMEVRWQVIELKKRAEALAQAVQIYTEEEESIRSKSQAVLSAIGAGYCAEWNDQAAVGAIAAISTVSSTLSATVASPFISPQQHSVNPATKPKPKSFGWRLYHTGKAVASSALSVAGFLMTGVLAIESGVGVPIVALNAIYSSNTVANNLVDIYNCWLGDTEEVGGVNCLKDILIEHGGDLGEILGTNRETGETIGEIIYTSGGVVSALSKVEALVGKTIQAGDLWENTKDAIEEVPTGLKGLWEIATRSDVRNIKYDLKLLSYQVENIKKVHSAYKLLDSVANTTEKLTRGLIDITTSIFHLK